MTTAREELEDLLSNLGPEIKEALKEIPFNEFPVEVLTLGVIIKGLPAEIKEKYDPLLTRIQKLNALMRIAVDNANVRLEKPSEEPIQLAPEITREMSLAEVADILSTSVKKDDTAAKIVFCTMLLAQTANDQLNVAFQAESSTGKSYVPIEIANYFPESELKSIAGASPNSFYHESGKWDAENKVINVDLECKILLFLDMPHFLLLEKLRPLLSHDKKELVYKIADRNQKAGLRTKTVILRGFSSVIFCTAKLNSDEQERTRLFLLSPSTERGKLEESLKLIAMRKGNPADYRRKVLDDPCRSQLSVRIKAIRQTGIKDITIPNYESVYNRFIDSHKDLQPRHQRDFPRLIALIKAHALLNVFNRKRSDDSIEATQQDVEAGFALYSEIQEENELGLSPFVYRVYKDVIKPILDKPEKDENNEVIGIGRKKIAKEYHNFYHKPISSEVLGDILEQLEQVGLIEQKQDPKDRRTKLVYNN